MRAILRALFHISLITWFILHLTYPQITHTYIGTVYEKTVVAEKQLIKNSGSHVKYVFQYKDKEGNIRDSESIQGHSTIGFVTNSGTWVEKQLIENGKVYLPGWHFGMIIEFVILCFIVAFFVFALASSILCLIIDYHKETTSSCKKCGCPMCIFNKNIVEEDKPFFNKIIKVCKQFFNIT